MGNTLLVGYFTMNCELAAGFRTLAGMPASARLQIPPAKVLRVRSPEVRVSALAAARRKVRSPKVIGRFRLKWRGIDKLAYIMLQYRQLREVFDKAFPRSP